MKRNIQEKIQTRLKQGLLKIKVEKYQNITGKLNNMEQVQIEY